MLIGLLTFLLWLLIYGVVAYIVIWVILAVLALFIEVPPKIAQALYLIAALVILIWAIQALPPMIPVHK